MFIPRAMQSLLRSLMGKYPVVTVTGPRQSGKTTLVRETYPHKPYVNLEVPDVREGVISDPRGFFDAHPEGAILDEIQRVPELLSYIQGVVDEKKTVGLFVLTGGHQLSLHEAVAQSLAGRTALLQLLPLSMKELRAHGMIYDVTDYLLKGFYPVIYEKSQNPTMVYGHYVMTYVERDVRQMINVKDLVSFQRFLQLCAGGVGNLLNVESLCNDVGVSHNTVKSWLSLLEAAYLIYRLPPYFENFGKRMIKSPKLYFNDVGLVSYLLGLEEVAQITRDPLYGGLFENLVLLELLKSRFNEGKAPHCYYYRDNNGNEVDVVMQYQRFLIPIEIKATHTFNATLLKNLRFYKKLVGERCPVGFLIYNGEAEYTIEGFHVINVHHMEKIHDLLEKLKK